jgi:hypothetical protein
MACGLVCVAGLAVTDEIRSRKCRRRPWRRPLPREIALAPASSRTRAPLCDRVTADGRAAVPGELHLIAPESSSRRIAGAPPQNGSPVHRACRTRRHRRCAQPSLPDANGERCESAEQLKLVSRETRGPAQWARQPSGCLRARSAAPERMRCTRPAACRCSRDRQASESRAICAKSKPSPGSKSAGARHDAGREAKAVGLRGGEGRGATQAVSARMTSADDVADDDEVG